MSNLKTKHMARQEYIKELQLRVQEILQELRKRDKEPIIDELEAILKILLSNIIQASTDKSNQDEQLVEVTTSGNAKGKRSWENYIVDVLTEIGGKTKSADVTEAIVKANPDIQPDRVSHAVRHHLSKLFKNGKIGANKSKIRSEGYEFFIK
jgi:hypothetical protein